MKSIFPVLLTLGLFFSCQNSEKTTEQTQDGYRLIIGAYTQNNPEGIYYYSLDPEMKNPNLISNLKLNNSSFLALTRGMVYAVNEETNGMIQAYRFDEATGVLDFINEQETGGAHPCYVSVSNGMIYVANYSGGSLAALTTEPDGTIGRRSELIANSGSGPNTARQEKSHIHSAMVSPDKKTLWVADLGTDEVLIFDIEGQKLKEKTRIKTAPGSGPRHIVFHPQLPFAYLACELNNEIVQISTKDYSLIKTVSTLTEPTQTENYPADIHISPDGQFLYASNRGVNDLVFYFIHPETGQLELKGNESVMGDFPRNFAISKDGKYVAVANQKSDNVVFFKRDEKTGILSPTGSELKISMPVFVNFL